MLASSAQTLVEEVAADFRFAGIAFDIGGRGDDSSYLDGFAERLRNLGPI
jgi:hypothetical protein